MEEQEEKEEEGLFGDLHGQGGTLPCKQAKRGRPEGGCGVIPTEIFFIFLFIFSPKMTRFDIILK